MSRFSELAKLLGITAEKAKSLSPKVLNILEKVNTPEISTALKGSEKSKYLDALDQAYGPQSQRAKDMGFGNRDWYHGSTVDIPEFKKEALGLSTNANSAKKGFFFASDPSTASDYSNLAAGSGVSREAIELAEAQKKLDSFSEQLRTKYGQSTLSFGNPSDSAYVPGKIGYREKATSQELEKLKELETLKDEAEAKDFEKFKEANESDYDTNLREAKANKDFEISAFQRQIERNDNTKNVLAMRKKDLETNRIPEGLTKEDVLESIKNLEDKLAAGNKNIIDRQNRVKALEDTIAKSEDIINSKGQQVASYKLKGSPKNIHVKNYKGQGYRDTSFSDEMTKAQEANKDAVLFKNTYDPADPNNRVEQDIAAVFNPSQIRSKFAAFDPRFKNSENVLAGTAAIPAADINPLEAFKGVQENILEPVVSRYNKLKSYITEPLSKQLDLTKDKSASKDLKTALDMGLDPVNLIPGAAGIGAGALQILGEEEEE